MSPDLMYFISFLIFAFCAYKYGHKKLKDFLDQKIKGISNKLLQATEEKEQAQLALSAVKGEFQQFEQTLQERESDLKSRLQTLKEQHEQQLSALLHERKEHHQMLLNYDERVHMHQLKDDLAQFVLSELRTLIQHEPSLQKMFQEKSLDLLRD